MELRNICGLEIIHLFFVPKSIEPIPFAFLPVIIYPVLGVSHFFLTESSLVLILESDRLREIHTDPEKIRTVSVHARIFSTILAIAVLPIIILGYLLFEETSGWIELEDVTIPLILTLAFMLIAVGIASYLLSSTIRRNSENMIQIFAIRFHFRLKSFRKGFKTKSSFLHKRMELFMSGAILFRTDKVVVTPSRHLDSTTSLSGRLGGNFGTSFRFFFLCLLSEQSSAKNENNP